ncbi:MAG: CCA tRNA nucleotidyltransferase [Alphaproteobacteria bacterium]|nr:CCA tRNA nucleotidyltransferase [Alphaproteobacteria bacterium]
MQPVDRLHPPAWLAHRDVRRLVEVLACPAGPPRAVGGAVRDAVLGLPAGDVDLATPLPPDQVIQRLSEAGIRVVPTGVEHGTVTAVLSHRPIEVTSLRRDVETFGRKARVAFTDDWGADAARRDLTMNALYADPDGTLYDPVGGLADARAGRVRFIGDPAERLAEDGLRLLRFFRFHARFGRGVPDPDGLAACRAAAAMLDHVSQERIWAELAKLLATRDPAPTLMAMEPAGLLARVLPEARDLTRLARLTRVEPVAPTTIRRLAALAPGADPEATLRRLRGPVADARHWSQALVAERLLAAGAGGFDVVDRCGVAAAVDGACLRLADGARVPAALWRWRTQPLPRLPVVGSDLMAFGLTPGPALGRHLDWIRTWWRQQEGKPDRAACLAAWQAGVGLDGTAP